jgi:hypothetical protein
MGQDFLDVFMRSTPAEARERLGLPARAVDAQVLRLTTTLNGQNDSSERQAIVAYVDARISESSAEAEGASQSIHLTPELEELRLWVCRHYRLLQQQYLTPEVMEWARRTFNEEEFLAGLREIQTTGGLELKDFLHELEQEVMPRE